MEDDLVRVASVASGGVDLATRAETPDAAAHGRPFHEVVRSRVEHFKLALSNYSTLEVVQRFVTSGSCTALEDDQLSDLKQEVSRHFDLHHSTVHVVGSAKLGFSIAPAKRFRAFGEESDVDVAIVSRELYEKIWKELSRFAAAAPFADWPNKKRFLQYTLDGWIRPDLLPASKALPLADDWFEYFREVTNKAICGPYRVNAGVYYDLDFLERYQEVGVVACQQSIGESDEDSGH